MNKKVLQLVIKTDLIKDAFFRYRNKKHFSILECFLYDRS